MHQLIDSLNTKIESWYAAGQIDSLASVFAEDAWQLPPNSPPLVGRDSIRAFWSNAVQWGQWEFDLNIEDVVTADSLAIERGSYTMRFTAGPQAPIPSAEDRGNYVVLWRQQSDGHWRLMWDAPVSVLPLPGAPSAGAGPPGM